MTKHDSLANHRFTKTKILSLLGIAATVAAYLLAPSSKIQADENPKVIWYGTLEGGLAEAKRSNRPILLISAAPHCHSVSGVW